MKLAIQGHKWLISFHHLLDYLDKLRKECYALTTDKYNASKSSINTIWVINSLMSILIALTMYYISALNTKIEKLSDSLHTIETQVVATSSNRFTSSDGLEVWKEISNMRTLLAAIPKETPPKWFIDRVDKMEQTINHRIDALEQRIINGTKSSQ